MNGTRRLAMFVLSFTLLLLFLLLGFGTLFYSLDVQSLLEENEINYMSSLRPSKTFLGNYHSVEKPCFFLAV